MKKLIGIVIVIVLVVVVVGAAKRRGGGGGDTPTVHPSTSSGPTAAQPTFTLGSGDYKYEIKIGRDTRYYLAHVPSNYNVNKSVPMWVAMHGGSGSAEIMRDYYGIPQKADKEGFIAVFPHGQARAISPDLATWNAGPGECCAYAIEHGGDDTAFIRAVVKDVEQKFNIDSRRVYINGFSNGAMKTYDLACQAADIFAAAAPVSGTERTKSCNPSRPIPIAHFHSIDDKTVQYNGGCGDNGCVAGSASTPVPETINRWIARNNTSSTPVRIKDVRGAYCDEYRPNAGGAVIQLCVTEDGGHSWAGGQKPRLTADTPSRAINTTNEIWEFFKKHTL